jgi:hypothetical protein
MSLPYLQPYLGLSNGLNTLHAAGGPGGAAGGWVELGRTTLGSTSDFITVSSLANKRYYMIISNTLASATSITTSFRLGNSSIDTGTNYAWRSSNNGAADATVTSTVGFTEGGNTSNNNFTIGYLANYSSKEKLWIHHANVNTGTGSGNVPNRYERVGKWTNTSNPMDIFSAANVDTADYASGSEVVVLGWDPADTHTNNFWEELAAVDLSGGDASSLSSGTITAKKYLWVQFLVEVDTLNADCFIKFNNNSANYAWRRSIDGGSDTTVINRSSIDPEGSLQTSQPMFVNMFVINNNGYEKLFIGHSMRQNTAGAGNAPTRREWVGKWANTTQVTNISLTAQTGNLKSKTIMRVWGAD